MKSDPSYSYQQILEKELSNRQQVNPKYSMRDFARHLGLTPSHLCEVLKGKKGLSKVSAEKVNSALGWRHQMGRHFSLMVSAESGRSTSERNLAKQGLARLPFIPNAKQKMEEYLNAEIDLKTLLQSNDIKINWALHRLGACLEDLE